jgi:long-chain acyl-CoA synthetase
MTELRGSDGRPDADRVEPVPLSRAEATARLTAPGERFEMEEVEIRGVRTRTWVNAPASLREVLDRSLRYGDDVFLVYEDERMTFDQHYRRAATLAQRLAERFGVAKGDRVAIAMRNLPEWVITFWAAVLAGAVVVPLNAWWTGEELRFALEDSGAVVVVADEERADRLGTTGALPGLRTMIVASEHRRPEPAASARGVAAIEVGFSEALGAVDPDAVPPEVDLQPEDDVTIFYTSGTTGRPKGAVGTHRNICTNLMSLAFVNAVSALRSGGDGQGAPGAASSPVTGAASSPVTGAGATVEGRRPNVYLLSVPLFHATGCHSVLVPNTAAGGRLVMMHHFDPERALELIEREQVTTFGGVPTMVMAVLDSPDFSRRDVSSVRSVSYGGAPAPPDLVRRIRAHFPSGRPGNGYGLTETSSITCMISGEDYLARPDSVGAPVPVTDVAVVPEGFAGNEPDPSLPSGPEVTGELWVKGPQVVRGYWRRPAETARSFTRGWLHTGDVARIDQQGYVSIVDRAKDVIIRGGENVYSAEVEDVLYEHPAVAECAVIGVPHPLLGEEVGVVVVLRPGHKVTADDLVLHVRDRLAAFKVPTRIWFRRALPHSPAGKVLKRPLRAEVLGDEVTGAEVPLEQP